ncbi:LysR substrate-binding domain-containing protein [Burkholderia sp. WSM2232]|uniref:LysR substrate-binding domain-containing protein n=1 Tax=Burkholderia sp. WSM2232 TaxID=944436 RepID=UPI0022B3F8F9|nr:LysR substrate-binding domain-containing protein [Burkholderia sp. WSM2232]
MAELLGERWCIQSYGDRGSALVQSIFDQNGLARPARIMSCEAFAAVLGLARSTDTLCVMTRPLFDVLAPAHGLVALDIEERLPSITVAVVWRKSAMSLPAVDHLVNCLKRASTQIGLAPAEV